MNFMNAFHQCCSPPGKLCDIRGCETGNKAFEILINADHVRDARHVDSSVLGDSLPVPATANGHEHRELALRTNVEIHCRSNQRQSAG